MTTEKVGLIDFLENHLDFRWKLAAFGLLVALVVGGIGYIARLRTEVMDAKAEAGTLSQRFQAFHNGKSVVAGNQLTPSQGALTSAALQAFGSEIQAYMGHNGSKIQSLTEALGRIDQQVVSLQGKLNAASFGKARNPKTGKLTNFSLQDSRTGPSGELLPPLNQVNLSYDPSQTNPAQAFAGTTWTNFSEHFKLNVGQWKSNKDGSYRTTLSLTRSIFGPSGNQLGSETIPLAQASTLYSPTSIVPKPEPVSPWLLELGVAARHGAYTPAISLNYSLTQGFGVWAGTANNAAEFGLSIRLGGSGGH